MILLLIFFPLFSFLSCMFFSQFFGRGSLWVSTVCIGLSLSLSLIFFYQSVLLNSRLIFTTFYAWLTFGVSDIIFTFSIDGLTSIMCVMILVVSFSVHLFSIIAWLGRCWYLFLFAHQFLVYAKKYK